MSKPCSIYGQEFPSQKAAAKALNMSQSAVSKAARRNLLGNIGQPRKRGRAVEMFDVKYRSVTECAQALGWDRVAVWGWVTINAAIAKRKEAENHD